MPYTGSEKSNFLFPKLGMVCFFLFAILFVMSQGTGEAAPFSHSHKAEMKSPAHSDNLNLEKHSCPLTHHVKNASCPLSHQSAFANGIVIKNCGGNGAEDGVSTGFSKLTVAPPGFDNFNLPQISNTAFLVSSFYIPILSGPLDHPPRFI